MRVLALTGARAGSRRLPNKNTRVLGDKPLWKWTLDAAMEAGMFESIWLSTDIPEILGSGFEAEGFQVIPRPANLAKDTSPDFGWIRHALDYIGSLTTPITSEDIIFLLRPTSPFRSAETIKRAWEQWQVSQPMDSMRSVRPSREHPAKTWMVAEESLLHSYKSMEPVMSVSGKKHLYELPTQSLMDTYIQTGGLEILRCSNLEAGNLSGERVGMFLVEGAEALDLNDHIDWSNAERYGAPG